MKRYSFLIILLVCPLITTAQYNDTSTLNNHIRENIRDKRPEKVTAEQIQSGLLGISYLLARFNTISFDSIRIRPTLVFTESRYKPITYFPTWTEITSKPTLFTPAIHTHAGADIATGTISPSRLGTGSPTVSNFLRGDGMWAPLPATPQGTVTSVAISLPSLFTVTGSPVTSAGSISATLSNQAANTVLRVGSTAGVPSFSALAATDIPILDWSKIGTGKPVTLSGYGIQDAYTQSQINSGFIQMQTSADQPGTGFRLAGSGFIGNTMGIGTTTINTSFFNTKLSVNGGIAATGFMMFASNNAPNGAGFCFQNANNTLRWAISAYGTEGAGNGGYDIVFGRYDNASTLMGPKPFPLYLQRSTANVGISMNGAPSQPLEVGGTIKQTGSMVGTRIVTGSTTLNSDDYIVLNRATTAVPTITLPTASSNVGRVYILIEDQGSILARSRDMVISPAIRSASSNYSAVRDIPTGFPIDDAPSASRTSSNSVTIVSDGTNWIIVK